MTATTVSGDFRVARTDNRLDPSFAVAAWIHEQPTPRACDDDWSSETYQSLVLQTLPRVCQDCGSIGSVHGRHCEWYGQGSWNDGYVDGDSAVDVYDAVDLLLGRV